MHADFFPPVLVAANDLPLGLAFWGTPIMKARTMPTGMEQSGGHEMEQLDHSLIPFIRNGLASEGIC